MHGPAKAMAWRGESTRTTPLSLHCNQRRLIDAFAHLDSVNHTHQNNDFLALVIIETTSVPRPQRFAHIISHDAPIISHAVPYPLRAHEYPIITNKKTFDIHKTAATLIYRSISTYIFSRTGVRLALSSSTSVSSVIHQYLVP